MDSLMPNKRSNHGEIRDLTQSPIRKQLISFTTRTYAVVQRTVTFVTNGKTVKTMTVDDSYVLQDFDYYLAVPNAVTSAFGRSRILTIEEETHIICPHALSKALGKSQSPIHPTQAARMV